MEPTTAATALLAGAVTSVHCVGMCGPMACSIGNLQGGETRRLLGMTAYHGGRLVSYSIVGALCGLLGQQPLQWFFDSPAVLLPWVLVLAFLLVATGLHKRLPQPAFLTRLLAPIRSRAWRLSATRGGFALGFMTPLLPCAPLYLLFGVSLVSGSALRGAELAAAFALGTIPLLWVTQQSFGSIRRKLSPLALARLQRGLALTAALIIAWRLHDTIPLPFLESASASAAGADATELPSCCP